MHGGRVEALRGVARVLAHGQPPQMFSYPVMTDAVAGLRLAVLGGSAAHALLIEGTMETLSKAALCALAVAATVKVLIDLKIGTMRPRQKKTDS